MTIIISTDDNVRFQSLSGLKTSIEERMDREYSSDELADFIYLCERELERVLTVPYREASVPISIAAQANNLPADFKAVARITLSGDPKSTIQQVSPEVLDSNNTWKSPGKPQAFAIVAGELWVAPVPDGVYPAMLVYEQKLTALTESRPSNWLMDRHPDVYFYGALVQAADHVGDTARVGTYRAAFDNAVAQVNEEGRRYRFNASPVRLRSPVVV